ncbi:MAG: hypothetical protein J6V21_01985 [Alistipes sp.]|nr:hypothetical protein [Alistipes sp.]
MNYSELINHFWQARRATRVSAIEADLYYFLLQESSSRGLVATFEVSNRLICGCLDISEKTLIKVRLGLREKGFISFEGGQRKMPIYTISALKDNCKNFSLAEENEEDITVNNSVISEDNCKNFSLAEENKRKETKETEEVLNNNLSSSTSVSPSSSSLPITPEIGKTQTLPLEIPTNTEVVKQVVAVYLEKCVNMPSIRVITDKRKSAVMARISQHSLATVYEMLTIAGNSEFLNGKNNRGWVADFDWLFKPENFVKVIERKYENNRTNSGTTPTMPTTSVASSNGRVVFSGNYDTNF